MDTKRATVLPSVNLIERLGDLARCRHLGPAAQRLARGRPHARRPGSRARADEFIKASKEEFARGVRSNHVLCGMNIDIAGTARWRRPRWRSSQRAPVDGVPATSSALAASTISSRSATAVGLVLRQPIYEKDRIDPVDPAAKLLEARYRNAMRYPEGYRHLAYLQTKTATR